MHSKAWVQEGCTIAAAGLHAYLGDMEVHLSPETEKKLTDLAALSGRGTDDLVEDAMAGYFDEALQLRETLDSRYEDLKRGRVRPIPGDEVEAYFRERSATRRSRHAGS